MKSLCGFIILIARQLNAYPTSIPYVHVISTLLSDGRASAVLDKQFRGTNHVGILARCFCGRVYMKKHPDLNNEAPPGYCDWAPSIDIPCMYHHLLRCDLESVNELRIAEEKAFRKDPRSHWSGRVSDIPYAESPSKNENTAYLCALLHCLHRLDDRACRLTIYCRIHAFLIKKEDFEYGVRHLCNRAWWAKSQVRDKIETHAGRITFLTEVLMNTSIGCSLAPIGCTNTTVRAHLAEDPGRYVKPTAGTAKYADAGIIHSNQDATVDTSRSFGYKTDEFNCVASIMSNTEVHPINSGPKIAFWVVGGDYCGRSHDFECDGVGGIEVRNAFAERGFDDTRTTKFLVPRAARPKAVHAMEGTLAIWYNRAVAAIVVICVLYTAAITVVWSLIYRIPLPAS